MKKMVVNLTRNMVDNVDTVGKLAKVNPEVYERVPSQFLLHVFHTCAGSVGRREARKGSRRLEVPEGH